MRIHEARAAIGEAISAAITWQFARDFERFQEDWPPRPAVRFGSHASGHDPSRVPDVPRAEIRIDRTADQASAAFTWKAETGAAPWAYLTVRPQWLREVAHAGFAVLDGHAVLDVLTRDEQGRPADIVILMVAGYFDSSIHGWRAWGEPRNHTVTWANHTPAIAALVR